MAGDISISQKCSERAQPASTRKVQLRLAQVGALGAGRTKQGTHLRKSKSRNYGPDPSCQKDAAAGKFERSPSAERPMRAGGSMSHGAGNASNPGGIAGTGQRRDLMFGPPIRRGGHSGMGTGWIRVEVQDDGSPAADDENDAAQPRARITAYLQQKCPRRIAGWTKSCTNVACGSRTENPRPRTLARDGIDGLTEKHKQAYSLQGSVGKPNLRTTGDSDDEGLVPALGFVVGPLRARTATVRAGSSPERDLDSKYTRTRSIIITIPRAGRMEEPRLYVLREGRGEDRLRLRTVSASYLRAHEGECGPRCNKACGNAIRNPRAHRTGPEDQIYVRQRTQRKAGSALAAELPVFTVLVGLAVLASFAPGMELRQNPESEGRKGSPHLDSRGRARRAIHLGTKRLELGRMGSGSNHLIRTPSRFLCWEKEKKKNLTHTTHAGCAALQLARAWTGIPGSDEDLSAGAENCGLERGVDVEDRAKVLRKSRTPTAQCFLEKRKTATTHHPTAARSLPVHDEVHDPSNSGYLHHTPGAARTQEAKRTTIGSSDAGVGA
ncbi:hypothetical protein FB451DRAFT_1454726 [Mycena latifolia]|nr:hypothetical protein FB451DRAFT_1454726 [Mycena latifolia]